MSSDNKTIQFYNENAGEYFESTVGVDFGEAYKRFASYLPEPSDRDGGVRIIDVGCGSGRDAAAFCVMGYEVCGLDASEELARAAKEKLGIDVTVCDMASWEAEEPFDGVWCCASLLHLDDAGVERFFRNLPGNVTDGGAVFISVKTGIRTGYDEKGRFMRNFTEDEVCGLLEDAGFEVKEVWMTEDGLGRDDVLWVNVIATK